MTKALENNSSLKAQVLSQSLPYIQKFYGKIFVIKYGGSAMESNELKIQTVKDFLLLSCVGIKIVIVHGGGKEINSMLGKLKLPVKFINGQRVTDLETMKIVEMVLVGKIQKEIVNLMNTLGGNAIGLSGKDGKLFLAGQKKGMKKYGYVGNVKKVNAGVLYTLLDNGFIPVISSIGSDENGKSYNINADSVAESIASELKASKLLLMTDTPGILLDKNKPNTLISKLSINTAKKLIKQKKISDGMIPKINSAISALRNLVGAVQIIDGRLKHSTLLEIFTDSGIGTMITLK